MFPTDEVRWFFKGAIPASVTAWFTALGCVTAVQPPRIDYYLQLNDDDSLGVNLREGRIEVKQRAHPGELVRFGERSAGQVEAWRKWGFGLAEADENVTEAAQWIGVWKSRRWCVFAVGDDGRITPTSITTIPEQGCACELTKVRLTDTSEIWWSLGFEAFGGAAGRRERLRRVAQLFLKQDDAPILTADNSYSYLVWLQIVGD